MFAALMAAVLFISTGLAASAPTEAQDGKNYRVFIEGTFKEVPVQVEALVALNDGFQKNEMGNQINFMIITDQSNKNKVRLNLSTQMKTAEGQFVQNGFVVCYFFKPDLKTLAWKSADSQIYITVKEE